MRIIQPLESGKIYHIYNRGNNGENLFIEKRNYYYFLHKYNEYCFPAFETLAYVLLKNHFHLMVRVRNKIIVQRRNSKVNIESTASRQLSHFFNCYAQSINKAYNRHGKLFEVPFRRKAIDNDNHFSSLILYIHLNPQLHKFVKDFRDWEFTSWHSYITNQNFILEKSSVIDWFGNPQDFINAHLKDISFDNFNDVIIE